jgi:hypothetical protein
MKKLLSIMLALLFVSSGMVYAQGFTNQSINGHYGAQATYGDNEGAGVGIINSSGNGNVSGDFSLNVPGLGFRRTNATATVTGDYTVNSEGTIPLTWTITFENGMKIDETGDCVIMQADVNKVATEVFCVGREGLTPMRGFMRGGVITMTFKRLPD